MADNKRFYFIAILLFASPWVASANDAAQDQLCTRLRENVHEAPQWFHDASIDKHPHGDTTLCELGYDTLPTSVDEFISPIMNLYFRGKTFNEEGTELINRTPILSFIGYGESATARVYVDPSRIDGRPVYAIDYSDSQDLPPGESSIRKWRDEIREIAPGTYIGTLLRREEGDSYKPSSLYFALFENE